MLKHRCLLTIIGLLGCGLFCSVAVAGGQIIGLYHRGGVGGLVLEELLRTEGIPYARVQTLDHLEQSGLRGLVLDACPEDAVPEIKEFLERGGTLLALKPSGALAEALGLAQVGVEKDGHLLVGGKAAAIVSYEGPLQLFGASNGYKGGEILAPLDGSEEYGGIIRVRRGTGTALVVAFDLPTTLLTLLQPESECGKTIDASNVEYELFDVPQVDLMRRLLVGFFLDSLDVPLLRKWYFPSQYPAMLVVLGDQDGASFEQIKVVLDMMKELETPYTLYVTPTSQPITKEQFKVLADGGMEFALHPDLTAEGKFTVKEFNAQWKKAETDVGCTITGERTHGSRWESFRQTPTWAEKAGLQYDAILGVRVWESKPSKNGYALGTGLPYRFIDPETARRLDFLEIATAGIDNSDFWKPRQYTVNYKPNARKTFLAGLGLTEDEAFETWKQTFDQAVEKHHAAVGYCWHPVYLAAKKLQRDAPFTTDVHFRKCIRYAKSRGMGLTGSNAFNMFWRAREKVVFADVAWDPESATAEYRISSDVQVKSLTLLAPLRFHGKRADVSVNGHTISYVDVTLWGQPQAMWTVDVGRQESFVAIKYE